MKLWLAAVICRNNQLRYLHELIRRYEDSLDWIYGTKHDELFKWRAMATWCREWLTKSSWSMSAAISVPAPGQRSNTPKWPEKQSSTWFLPINNDDLTKQSRHGPKSAPERARLLLDKETDVFIGRPVPGPHRAKETYERFPKSCCARSACYDWLKNEHEKTLQALDEKVKWIIII